MRQPIFTLVAFALMEAFVPWHAQARGASAGSTPRITKVTVSPAPSAHDPFGSTSTQSSTRSSRGEHPPSASVDGRQRRADLKASRYLLAQQARILAREKQDIDARADRLYRASQVSAPIIVDAKACRRTGAHGESIYENCETAAAKPTAR